MEMSLKMNNKHVYNIDVFTIISLSYINYYTQ